MLTATWLRQLVGRWQRAVPEKTLDWLVDIPETLPVLIVDVDKLEQALNNLLGNAVRHSPPAARVSVRAWSAGNVLRLRISSTRPRLAPEEYDHLSELFYTGEVQGRFPTGVGLGLYVTRLLFERHGGMLEITRPTPEDDALGFELSIPASGNAALPHESARTPGGTTAARPPLRAD